jgi:hypothetical protein
MMDPTIVETITSWPAPWKVKAIQSFLVFANFYHRCIWNYSDICVLLTCLTRKTTVWLTHLSKRNSDKMVGPFKVVNKPGTHSYTLCLPPSMKLVHPVFHIAMLEPTVSNTIPSRILAYSHLCRLTPLIAKNTRRSPLSAIHSSATAGTVNLMHDVLLVSTQVWCMYSTS